MAWIALIGGSYINTKYIQALKISLRAGDEYFVECFFAADETKTGWDVKGPYSSEEDARVALKELVDEIEYEDSQRRQVYISHK